MYALPLQAAHTPKILNSGIIHNYFCHKLKKHTHVKQELPFGNILYRLKGLAKIAISRRILEAVIVNGVTNNTSGKELE